MADVTTPGRGGIAVCGEALVDLVEREPGVFRALPGGSPANVAVGLSRLDVPAELLARLSADGFGALLRGHLEDNGVGLHGAVDATQPTTLAVVSTDPHGVASYDFRYEGTADWQWRAGELSRTPPPGIVAVHTGSLALTVEPGASVLTDWLGTVRDWGTATISLDPNIRPGFDSGPAAALRRVEEQVGLADVVKVSEEDLAWLLPGVDPADVARRWRALGPALVVVTLGGSGCLAVGPDDALVRRPAVRATVADTVGAGDAFTAGLLAGLHRAGLLGARDSGALGTLGPDLLTGLLDEAGLVAALTCERAGADPPTRAEVRAATATREGTFVDSSI
ncbi:carbohydrate kinase [Streptomyces sp. PTM05]|uniref:Carbohydrate kinase n=1 Tax=Streptantibioticus parmotrematis TaxID=2873249 RepID=A0ABS7QRV0_9ACTN|nr:carbohydrate kinase [Streptantibioticus parmotrematis]MBY8885409.1 carbohydrate kinase [Streptantibioticus parmotrematis]